MSTPVSLECWLSFLTWLGSGLSGVLPTTLRLTLGPVRQFLPLARHVAHAMSP